MSQYQHILVGLDLHPECEQPVLERAMEIAQEHNAKITVLHAVEHINAYGVAQAYPAVLDVEDQLIEEAKQHIAKMCQKFNIDQGESIIISGSPKLAILDAIDAHNIDLVVLGSHGRHGVSVLLGSTANAVLHHATCDVLAVRVEEP